MMKMLKKLKQQSYIKLISELRNNEVIPFLAQDNHMDEMEVCDILCNLLQFEVINEIILEEAKPDLSVISIQEATEKSTLYVRDEYCDYLLVCNPLDSIMINLYTNKFGRKDNFKVMGCTPEIFANILTGYIDKYSTLTENSYEVHLNDVNNLLESISLDSIHHEENEIVKIVNSIIYDSLKQKASDIHIEVREDKLLVFYRIDGSLINVMNLKGKIYTEQIISRIKILSNLDISENRIPQDGRIKLIIDNYPVDFRVSIMPSIFGEDAVLRVLDSHRLGQKNQRVVLDDLNFPTDISEIFKRMLLKQHGMILITGPTGSGKTTTLYAMIDEINTGLDKIITIEDPVEYALDGVLQIPVNEKKGLTFAKGLRSILRHDPDVIMVGEIRDNETATIAVQAALTGHLVFTTVHANNVFNVLNRFKYMGVEKFSLVSALNCIISQRLIKLLCSNCAITDNDNNQFDELSSRGLKIDKNSIKKAVGCKHCHQTGYQNRFPINEVLLVDNDIKDQLMQQDGFENIKKIALAQKKWIPSINQLIDLLNNGLIDVKQFIRHIE